MKKKTNIANKITMSRLFVVALIILVYFLRDIYPSIFETYKVWKIQFDIADIIVLVLFIYGAFSDFLDGYLARKKGLVTTFGKFLDPIADKLLVNTMFIIFTAFGRIHWIFTVIIIGRDIVVDMIRFIMMSKNVVIDASKLGKLKTITQMVAIILLLLLPSVTHKLFTCVLVAIPAFISLVSGIDYFNKTKEHILADYKQ